MFDKIIIDENVFIPSLTFVCVCKMLIGLWNGFRNRKRIKRKSFDVYHIRIFRID